MDLNTADRILTILFSDCGIRAGWGICRLEWDQVSVRFRASKIAFGSARYCQASVSKSFFSNMTSLNELVVYGSVQNGKGTTERRPKRPASVMESTSSALGEGSEADKTASTSPSEIAKRPLVADDPSAGPEPRKSYPQESVLTLTSSTSLLSPFFLDSLADKKALMKKLQSIDLCDMEITCALDYWLWIELQKIFAPVNPTIHDPSILSLLGEHNPDSTATTTMPALFTCLHSVSKADVQAFVLCACVCRHGAREKKQAVV